MPDQNKRLLVEGQDDLYAIAQLMAKHVAWNEPPPVKIESCGGVARILTPGFIGLELKSRDVDVLGVVMDADESLEPRWQRIGDECRPFFPDFPPRPLPEGVVVVQRDGGKRFGIWIMPDNLSAGMLETFMKHLVPDRQNEVWLLARESAKKAKEAGAPYRDAHREKVDMYTWLAWQDEPAQTVGKALMQNILDGRVSYALPFVDWFCRLFDLQRRTY